MTAGELFDSLSELSKRVDLSLLQIVIHLEVDDDLHMGGVDRIAVDAGCTETYALVIDCNQDPKNCLLEDDE